MAIDFNSIPTNLRVPFVAVEFDASQATQGPALLPYQGVLVGQKLAAGSGAQDTLAQVTSVADVIALAGRGSMLHRMAIGWFASNKTTPVWIGMLADASGGVAATGTIVVAGPATATGTIPLYLGGVLVPVAVTSGDASTAIATNIAAAINANLDLPVTASVTSSTVTLTFRHKGLAGNSYDVRDSFNAGDALPAGVTLTITAMGGATAGTTNPTLTNLIAAMSTFWFQVWAHPYTDATSLAAIEADLADRFGPLRSMDGVAIASASGSFSTLTTLGTGRNSKSSCIIAQSGDTPLTPPMEFAAETAALVALAAQADPARPFQTLAYANAIGIPVADQFTFEERNLLLFDGIATSKTADGGVVQIERLITTYQENPSGAADTAYLDATTLFTLMYLRYSFRVRMQTKYPRHKLADDGTRFGSGQAVITPKLGKAEAVTWFSEMEDLGLVEDPESFKANLVVQRNASDPNRLDFLLPPELVGQLIVTAAQIQFLL